MEQPTEPLLRNDSFVRLWVGQGVSFVGDAITMVAVVVLVAELTGSAAAVGGVLVAQLLPALGGPLVGVLADRLDRKAVLVGADLARAALISGIIFVESIPVLYALVFLMGVARTFFNPTIRAAFPQIVGRGDLTRANSLISGTFSLSITAGPALSGVMVAAAGVDVAFMIDALTYLVSAAFLSTIRFDPPDRVAGARFMDEFREGISYLRGARVPLGVVLGAFLTILTINAVFPAQIFLAREFGAGEAGYGLMVGVWGGGMLLGSLALTAAGERTRLLTVYFAGIFLSGAALAAAGVAPAFYLALLALLLAGLANGTDNITADTILQKRVPDQLLGRVFSVRFMTYTTGELLAYPAGSAIAAAAGPRATFLMAGGATVIVGVAVLIFIASTTEK